MRCQMCGNVSEDGQDGCPTCREVFKVFGPSTDDLPRQLEISPQSVSGEMVLRQNQQGLSEPTGNAPLVSPVPCPVPDESKGKTKTAQGSLVPFQKSVTGRVILVEPAYSENPAPDICRIITRVLWIVLLLLSPILVLYWILVKVGGFPALLAFVGMFLLVRFISPTNLYAMFRIFSVLNPATRDPAAQVPVRYYRIREDESDAEAMVRVKGRLTHGNIGLDDRVTLFGRLSRGTLFARHGYNHRTASSIRTAGSYSWVGLLLTLIFILVVASEFYQPTMRYAQKISSLGGVK